MTSAVEEEGPLRLFFNNRSSPDVGIMSSVFNDPSVLECR